MRFEMADGPFDRGAPSFLKSLDFEKLSMPTVRAFIDNLLAMQRDHRHEEEGEPQPGSIGLQRPGPQTMRTNAVVHAEVGFAVIPSADPGECISHSLR